MVIWLSCMYKGNGVWFSILFLSFHGANQTHEVFPCVSDIIRHFLDKWGEERYMFESVLITCSVSVVYLFVRTRTLTNRRTEEVTGWGRLSPPPPILHVHVDTHWVILLLARTTQPLTKSLCVYWVFTDTSPLKANWDWEPAMCEGWDQTRSRALDEVVLNCKRYNKRGKMCTLLFRAGCAWLVKIIRTTIMNIDVLHQLFSDQANLLFWDCRDI